MTGWTRRVACEGGYRDNTLVQVTESSIVASSDDTIQNTSYSSEKSQVADTLRLTARTPVVTMKMPATPTAA